MALFGTPLAGIIAAFPVVVQYVSNIAALENRAPSITNELLNLIEKKVVELLARKRIPCFKASNVFFG
jgi:hypothetical protein